MKSLAKAAGLASCCLLATLSLAEAGEVKLSEVQLDRVTAGALLFETSTAFNPINNQLTPGGLLGPPLPPPPPVINPPPPITPPSNQVSVSDGGARATITLPTSNAAGSVNIVIDATSGPGFAIAEASVAGNLTGGPNSSFQGGGSNTSVGGSSF